MQWQNRVMEDMPFDIAGLIVITTRPLLWRLGLTKSLASSLLSSLNSVTKHISKLINQSQAVMTFCNIVCIKGCSVFLSYNKKIVLVNETNESQYLSLWRKYCTAVLTVSHSLYSLESQVLLFSAATSLIVKTYSANVYSYSCLRPYSSLSWSGFKSSFSICSSDLFSNLADSD